MGMEGDSTWGGEHTRQCTDDVLWNCGPETYIILLISIIQINSKNKIKINYKRFKNYFQRVID